MTGIPNNTKQSRKTRIIPAKMAGMTMGRVTVKNVLVLLAPNMVAASSNEESILSSAEAIEKKINGYRNKAETKIIPENEKMFNIPSIPKMLFTSIFNLPALGPSNMIQAIAPMKLGLAKVKMEAVRMNFRKGISVRATPKAIGTANAMDKITVPTPYLIVPTKL